MLLRGKNGQAMAWALQGGGAQRKGSVYIQGGECQNRKGAEESIQYVQIESVEGL